MSGASNAGERDYRATIAEMRKELVTALRSECRGLNIERLRHDRKFGGFARNRMRRLIRRIRAIGEMLWLAEVGQYAIEHSPPALLERKP